MAVLHTYHLSPLTTRAALLQVLLDAKVQNVKDAITAVSTEATQEAALEELLAKVTTKWASIDFNIIPYKDSKDILIMGPLDDIQVGREGGGVHQQVASEGFCRPFVFESDRQWAPAHQPISIPSHTVPDLPGWVCVPVGQLTCSRNRVEKHLQ